MSERDYDRQVRRRPQAIRNIEYFLLHFDDKGQIDKKEWEKGSG